MQATGQYPETVEYVASHNFLNIFRLQWQGCREAINIQACLGDFLRLEEAASLKRDDLSTRAKEKRMSVECFVLSAQWEAVKEKFSIELQHGLTFFENLSPYLDRFEINCGVEVRKYMIERLEKYKEYAMVLNRELKQEYHIDAGIFDRLLVTLDFQIDAPKNISTVNNIQ